MAKLDKPLLSLGAHGSLADTLSIRRRAGTSIAEKKPTPDQPNSLEQMYQRWRYKDYTAFWHTLSAVQKESYRAGASRFHMTPFSLFMRTFLISLSDIVGQWHLDNIIGGATPDVGPNSFNGAVFGALTVPGLIGNCLRFDGTDDWVSIPYNPLLTQDVFTVIARIRPTAVGGGNGIIGNFRSINDTGWMFSVVNGTLYFRNGNGIGTIATQTPAIISPNLWSVVGMRFQRPNLTFWHGQNEYNYIHNLASADPPTGVALGRGTPADAFSTQWFPGDIDEIIFYNRLLTFTQYQNHIPRRWP